jgi:hypothetical protein
MEIMEDWLSDDTPTPKVFCDLLTTQCEQESVDEYEERERICGACMITTREKQERKEKMKGKGIRWADEIEIEESLSGGKGKCIARFQKNQIEERAEDCGEGSSSSKANETEKKWYLKNGYMEDEEGDDEDEEDLFVYEEDKYGEGSSGGQEKDTGIGRVLKNRNKEGDNDHLFLYEEEKYGEGSGVDKAGNTGVGRFLQNGDAGDESGDDEYLQGDYEDEEEPYLDELL